MKKINFKNKGESGYEENPINAPTLNLLQTNIEEAINEETKKEITILYQNEEGVTANPSISLSLADSAMNYKLILIMGQKNETNYLGAVIPKLSTNLISNTLNIYIYNEGNSVTCWNETIFAIVGVGRK